MANAHDSLLPDSWGAKTADDTSICSSNTVSSFTGSYATATATFPSSGSGAVTGTAGNAVSSSTGIVLSASNAKRAVKIGGPAWLKREL